MKTTFKGFTLLVIMTTVFLIGGYVMLYAILFLSSDDPTATPFVKGVTILMFGFANTLIFLWAVIYMSPKVTLSETGVERTLLWRFKYFIRWEDMHEIAVVTVHHSSDWVFFSKKEIKVKGRAFFDIERLRLDRSSIFINTSRMCNRNTQSLLEAIDTYAPEALKPIIYKNKDKFYN